MLTEVRSSLDAPTARAEPSPRRALRAGRCQACQPIKFALAKMVATYLGLYDRSVQAVYYYEPDSDAEISLGIHIIVHVDQKDGELLREIARTAAALAEATRPLRCSEAYPSCFALDAVCVTDHEVFNRIGHAALIESIYAKPLVLWQR